VFFGESGFEILLFVFAIGTCKQVAKLIFFILGKESAEIVDVNCFLEQRIYLERLNKNIENCLEVLKVL
jgi:hypothetical protein